jgi:methionyl-tRNA formyltransferase
MRTIILTQDENLYLPKSFGRVCQALGREVVAIVASPAMSTHGGWLKGLARHWNLFGLRGTWRLGWRVAGAKLRSLLTRPGPEGPFYSIRQVARGFSIPYFYVPNLKSPQFGQLIDQYQPELLISISCPQIIGKNIRDRIPRGCINVHGAPLPRYRGLMPAFWMLCKGENTAAATVHELSAKLDDGPILLQREVAISCADTWDSLVCKTKEAGSQALIEAVALIRQGKVQTRENREDQATYFSFPTRADRLEFLKRGRRFF